MLRRLEGASWQPRCASVMSAWLGLWSTPSNVSRSETDSPPAG